MPRQSENPPELFDSLPYGFSQIAFAQGRRIVTFSGQVGWNETGQNVAEGDLGAQAVKAFSNLKVAVEAAGGTLDDILSLRMYLVAAYMPMWAAAREAMKAIFPPHNPPTLTLIGVTCLAAPDILIEIEALAVVS
jgi:enamine deaminase RidA (YjgF/YER057c/UK114 family)